MGKFDEYNINLKALETDSTEFKFQLGNLFFANIDAPEVQKGNLNVTVQVKRIAQTFELKFHCEGNVIVICDRCLDEMEQPIMTDDKLKVKFGEKYADGGDDIVIVPEEEGAINVAWFIYEFIALSIPMRHVHPAGKCNKSMTEHLKKHMVDSADDENFDSGEAENTNDTKENEEDKSIDPRWNDLKDLIDNNN